MFFDNLKSISFVSAARYLLAYSSGLELDGVQQNTKDSSLKFKQTFLGTDKHNSVSGLSYNSEDQTIYVACQF